MASRERDKAKKRKENRDTRPKAVVTNLGQSAQKVRLVLDEIRGKEVNEAMAILLNLNKGAGEPIAKLLKSAMANAENNMGLDPNTLFIAETYANEGPTRPWHRMSAMGKFARIRRRTSHVTIILDEK